MDLYRKIKSWHLYLVKKMFARGVAPWAYWKIIQKLLNLLFGNRGNTLTINECGDKYDNELLNDDLRGCIDLNPENKFTLDAEAINFIWNSLKEVKPKIILEFGSGTSTSCFHKYISDFESEKGVLITIDQDREFLNQTIKNLKKGEIKHFPILAEVNQEGYLLDKEVIKNITGRHGKIDFVLIDGPFGGWKIRQTTLLSIEEFCSANCIWFLDDAFRDSEMEILKNWRSCKNVEVHGVLGFEKGLGLGYVNVDS